MISILFRSSPFFQAPEELQWPATTITGPNDASGGVWALEVRYVFFFCFSSCFLLLANDFYSFRSSLFFSGTRRAMVAGDDHNGPKRRQMQHLCLGISRGNPRVFGPLPVPVPMETRPANPRVYPSIFIQNGQELIEICLKHF